MAKNEFLEVLGELSERELLIARMSVQRLSRREIAEELHISEHTVRNHLNHIFSKCGIQGNAKNKHFLLEQMLLEANQLD